MQGKKFRDQRASVLPELAGQRLDQGLAQSFDISRRRSRRAVDEGGVYLNGKRCRTAGRKLKCGDKLRIVLLEGERLIPFAARQLIWQQGHLYLIHKRSGQYAQEALHRSLGTLPDELARHLQLPPVAAAALRPVHRLDRGTSGLMLFCSDPGRLQQIQKHWRICTDKHYVAVVEPAPTWDEQRIRLPIGGRRNARGCYTVSERGRECDTRASVLERRGERALMRLIPQTGRTHQLRVHLSALGCPILGDARYGGRAAGRLMLHAEQLRITAPAMPETHYWNVPTEEDWQW
jgi:23S rRNA pseudouridine1911/1915/1917 synthase